MNTLEFSLLLWLRSPTAGCLGVLTGLGSGVVLIPLLTPGLGFSPDNMLQFRIFAYADAHRYRLGSTNYTSLPVNRPQATAAHTYHRDGFMRVDGNGGGPVEDPRYGVSLALSYRAQFDRILQRASSATLLQMLKSKVEKESS